MIRVNEATRNDRSLRRTALWLGVICLLLAGPWHAYVSAATASLIAPSDDTAASPPVDVRLSNEYIAIIVNATEQNTARFAVETTGGDPDRVSDDNSPLIYKVPGQSPWTSYTTIRIDGTDYVFGGEPTERAGRAGSTGEELFAPRLVDDNRIEAAYRIGPLEVTQVLSIIRSTTTGLLDTVRIAYELDHVGDRPADVGLRLMLDTMLGQNDGAPFRVEELAITSDTAFDGELIPEFWQAFDSLADPRVTAQGSLRGRDITPPSRVTFSNWGALADGLWDFVFEPGRDFTRLGEFELDSATAMYWEPERLQPGERRQYVVHYGLGGISISPEQLSLGVTSPASVTAEPDREVTFPIVAYVQNTGEGEAREVFARLSLPSGLKPAEGETLDRRLGTLPPGRTAQVTWRVALDRAVGGELTYTARVEAINAEANEVRRAVSVVAPAKLSIELVEPNGKLRIAEDAWQPLPYKVSARVSNSGGSDAESVTLRWEAPVGLEVAAGDRTEKPIGPLATGESTEVSWHIRPATITESQPYPFVGNLAYSVKGVIAGQEEEQRADGFLDIPALASAVKVDTSQQERVSVGEYVMVRIATQNIRTFYGAQLKLEYDPRALELVGGPLGVDRGRLFIEGAAEPTYLAWTAPRHEISDEGTRATIQIGGDRRGAARPTLHWVSDTLATLRFRALTRGDHVVRILPQDVRIYDRQNQTVRVDQIQDGTIRVRGQ